MSDKNVLRIIDANANRLREALRVIEEYFRFVCDDKPITAKLKAVRHSIVESLKYVDDIELLRSRDSGGDVGTVSNKSEKVRADIKAVVVSNFKRGQEASRVLEEYGKLVSADTSEGFKKIRFVLYNLEKEIILSLKKEI